MIKLKPITKQEYDMAQLQQQLTLVANKEPTVVKGIDGTNGRDGVNGTDGKDGVTTTVVKEVLANKEALLGKEEFEKFKKIVLEMENSLRQELAKTSNYFPGGGGTSLPIVQVIEVDTDTTITASQLSEKKINVILVGVAGITITLPAPTPTKIVWVQQGYTGAGSYTVTKV